ncbi:hypothetical protein C7M84_016490 [Penaeus vannamei]|uniref:Uncharacterized protein n=1 Tax=Penaeus vannamei TaxID=6689 RepID=A0A3R7LVG8_PENVA|nr:hypothetical protein C7M84_016490 [Penaeus vannamei]
MEPNTHKTVDEALRRVSWASLLKSLDLEEGWAALRTPARCREKVVCEVHRLLRGASPHALRLVRAFVPHVGGASKYKEAAVAGLGGRGCASLYPSCSASGLQFLANLPAAVSAGSRRGERGTSSRVANMAEFLQQGKTPLDLPLALGAAHSP